MFLYSRNGIEARAVLVDVGQVAVTQDSCFRVLSLQLLQQFQQGLFLLRCPCVGCPSLFVIAAFVADTKRVAVVAYGMGADQLLMARLVGRAVAGDVVVVARESKAVCAWQRMRAVTGNGRLQRVAEQ